ncbi:Glycogen synthase [Bacillus paralicheniformis]|uniref:Glycosyltransferase family 4 protein n=2 Tax=Bacillus paralicheniformis TaxID=1648923 RepID=A0AAW6KHJ0_9BACI|nr:MULTISPECIES: glycosyltransferase family 4 protein [Bacillus]MCQ5455989.1 glycosyltransferase family 4 protein [Bacillus paralicheniformis]MCY1629313.1 glycosyltransferase family 4 protein [Bacillus paralicheniformis]MDE1453949.1 glycosyltransferase family 4 protein [Bacillus paralicheniformis]MDW6053178.1 glycosyltransferase family 4 protein [Bacillus paralicheniformis]MED1714652.1 glycosyltransferase family 4 protein [Bacillus paralicheniformis]
MINVLLLSLENPLLLKSGAGRYVKSHLELLRNEVSFTVCTTAAGQNSNGWKTLEIPLDLKAFASFEEAVAAMNFQMIKTVLAYKGQFNFIHANDDITAPAAVYLSEVLALPLISTVHGLESGRKTAAGENVHPYRASLERLLAEKSDQILVLSSMMKTDMQKAFSLPFEQVRVIPHPCIKSRTVKKRMKSVPYFFSCGRFVPEKGFIEWLHAFQQLRKRQPDLELVIAGEGPLQSGIETKARELGIKESVTILPFLCEEERESWLAFCEMAVFPSCYEPFGIAAQESMAAGAAVAVGNNGGWNDFVIDRVTGFQVDFNHPDKAAYALAEIVRDKEQLHKVGQTAEAYILDLHDPGYIKNVFLQHVYHTSF